MKTTKDFLKWLRADGPWTLTAIVPDGAITTRVFADVNAAVKWAKVENKKAGIYYALNPLVDGYKANKKASKADVAALAFLHVDIDPTPGKPIDAERARALKSLQDFDPAPTMIIDSGGGFQGLWRLNNPVLVSDEWPVDKLEAFNIHLENLLSADRCHNIDRILRLPGTVNWPNAKKRAAGRVARQSSIVALSDQTYPISAFSPATEAATARIGPVQVVSLPPELPEVDLGNLPVDMRWKIIIRRGYDPGDEDLWASKSECMFAVTCVLVRAKLEDDLIAAVLLDPDLGISEHCLHQPQHKQRNYVARQITRAKEICNG